MTHRAEKTAAALLILSLALAGSSGCGNKEKPIGKSTNQNSIVPVKVREVSLTTLRNSFEFVGNIKAQYDAEVFPKVSGRIMEKVLQEGDPVKKDDALFYIDRDEVGFKFEKAPVDSPISGVVAHMYADVGQKVSPNSPVAYVVDMQQVRITLEIPEKYIATIRIGQETDIRVDTYPEKVFRGQITKMSPVLDPVSRTTMSEIQVDNKEGLLRPGMFARVELVINEAAGVPVVIKEAVIGREPETYIYVVEGDKAVKRRIELGLKQNDLWEVTSGVNPGDLVVIMGQQKLRDGAAVKVEREDAEKSASSQKADNTTLE